jgi:hypothetical protein
MVELADDPAPVGATELAAREMGAFTPSERAVIPVALPSVAVTLTLYEPAGVPCGTVATSVAVEGELASISTLAGDTEQVGVAPEPVEVTEQLSETKPESPAMGVTVTVELALPPSETAGRGVAETATCGM